MKMRMRFLLILVVLCCVALPAFSQDVELLVNPDFEAGSTAGWEGRSCTLNLSTDAYSGSYSGVGTERTSSWMGVKQSLLGRLTDGETYTISGWVKTSGTADYVKCSVEQGDSAGTAYIDVAEGTASSDGWIELAGTFTLTVTGTLTTLDIYFEGPEPGIDVYVDNASVFGPGVSTEAVASVDSSVRYQTLDGFGAAGCWYENYLLGHPDKETLYDLLFRELSLDIYRYRNTYDIDADYLNRNAQIINEVREIRPELKLKVAAWSPPASMKSNGNTREGALAKDANGEYMYDEYAQWWADSLAEFDSLGITPDYISIQNEPDYTNSGWDTCVWTPEESADYGGYAEAFRAVYNLTGLNNFVGPDNSNFALASTFIDALTAEDKSHMHAYAHHLYGDVIADMATFAANYNDLPRFMTEFSSYEDSAASTYADAMNLAELMSTALTEEQVSAYIYWDLYWVGPRGLITVETSTYTIWPLYYAFKHYSAFTESGWERIQAATDSLNLKISAFISDDENQVSVIIVNSSTSDMTVQLPSVNGFSYTESAIFQTTENAMCESLGVFDSAAPFTVPAESITTIAMASDGLTTPLPSLPPATPTPMPEVDCSGIEVWTADAVYEVPGYQVQYDGIVYENQWWTSGDDPSTNNGEFAVWQFVAACSGDVTPTPTAEEETPTPTPVGILGDVNGDGTVTIVDALMTAQYYVGLDPAGFDDSVADVNCDGSITIVDALMIAQYYVGLLAELNC